MSGVSKTTPADRTTLSRIMRALRMVTVPLPHLAGLAAAVRVDLDDRVRQDPEALLSIVCSIALRGWQA